MVTPDLSVVVVVVGSALRMSAPVPYCCLRALRMSDGAQRTSDGALMMSDGALMMSDGALMMPNVIRMCEPIRRQESASGHVINGVLVLGFFKK